MAPGIHDGLQFTDGGADPKNGTAFNEHSLHGDDSGALSATNPHPYGRLPCIGEASRQASRSRHSNVSSTVAVVAVGLQRGRNLSRPSSSLSLAARLRLQSLSYATKLRPRLHLL